MKKLLFSFEGRVGRQTWWMTMLGIIALSVVAQILIVVLGTMSETAALIGAVIVLPVMLAALVAGFAVQAKRWHDVDKSGWWLLIGLVPVIGLYALVMNGFVKGTEGGNQFGPDPLQAG